MLQEVELFAQGKGSFNKRDNEIVQRLLPIFETVVSPDYQLTKHDFPSPYISELADTMYFRAVRLSRKRHDLPYQETYATSVVNQTKEEPPFSEDELHLNAALLKAIAKVVDEETRALIKSGDVESVRQNFPADSMVIVFTELIFSSEMKHVYAYSALKQLQADIVKAIDTASSKERSQSLQPRPIKT